MINQTEKQQLQQQLAQLQTLVMDPKCLERMQEKVADDWHACQETLADLVTQQVVLQEKLTDVFGKHDKRSEVHAGNKKRQRGA